MKQTLLALAVTLALFCALYGLFWAVAVSTPHPAPKNAPETREIDWRKWT